MRTYENLPTSANFRVDSDNYFGRVGILATKKKLTFHKKPVQMIRMDPGRYEMYHRFFSMSLSTDRHIRFMLEQLLNLKYNLRNT